MSKSVKKKTAKAVTKKAKSIKQVVEYRDGFRGPTKNSPLPSFRYLNVTVSDISNEKFPEMVQITAGPAKYKGLYGKKFVNVSFAKIAVDEYQAESLIGKGRKSVERELVAVGITPYDNSALDTE